jgi:hypothetical protein
MQQRHEKVLAILAQGANWANENVGQHIAKQQTNQQQDATR